MIDASDILIIDIYMIDSIQMVVGSGVGLVGVAGFELVGVAGEGSASYTVSATVAMGTCGFLSAGSGLETVCEWY